MPNLALCEYALPNGRICRQPRLRNESHCRFHIRQKRDFDYDQHMYELNRQLNAMDTLQLLQTLMVKLENIRIYLRCYPEALLALIVAIDHLKELDRPQSLIIPESLTSPESMTRTQPQQNQSPAPIPHIPKDVLESLIALMSYSQEAV